MLTACTAAQAHAHAAAPASKSGPGPVPPVPSPDASVDAASQHKANDWLAGAAVPPAAARSKTQPVGVANNAAPQMWCQPMAHAVGYWTVPNMPPDDTLAWLRAHASRGMDVYAGSGNAYTDNATDAGGTVVDQPELGSLEALIFTVTSVGSGAGIRADAFTMAADSVCVTPPPGTSLGIGG